MDTLTPLVMIPLAVSLAAYFYSARRKNMAPPALEVLVNCSLLTGVVLCIMIGLQEEKWWAWVITCLPAGALFVIALIRNHALALATLRSQADEGPRLVCWCRRILLLPVFAKIPLLLLLCLPVLLVLISILLLFGQQPDSMIRAFTDTYKQGLSQLDSRCIGVPCPEGHFLCSVAAGGHPGLVKPIRAGIRRGKRGIAGIKFRGVAGVTRPCRNAPNPTDTASDISEPCGPGTKILAGTVDVNTT